MTDSSDYIGELEADEWWCPNCAEVVPAHHVTFEERHEQCGVPVYPDRPPTASDERAAWADHFKSMAWAPPEEVEELRRDAERQFENGYCLGGVQQKSLIVKAIRKSPRKSDREIAVHIEHNIRNVIPSDARIGDPPDDATRQHQDN